MPDLSLVPLTALSPEVQHLISTFLNPPKVIPAGCGTSGLPRDWRGLAQVCSIGGELMPAIASHADPTKRILDIVQTKSQNFTLKSLQDALKSLERWDILEDSEPLLERDALLYMERLKKSQETAEGNDYSADAEILTFDDQFRIERGEGKQHYDAFLLYANEDEEFAQEMIENLEKKNHLKLCLKERDLVPGLSFEHEAIMRLISERCNRLITIISPDFFKSPANKFFLNYAQASGIDKRQERKIIPCVYKNCELPPQLTYYSKIYYKQVSPDFFWDKLTRSMKAIQSVQNAQMFTKNSSDSKAKSSNSTKNTPLQEPKKKVEKNPPVETSKAVNGLKNRVLLPWKRRENAELSEKPNKKGEKLVTQDPIPKLPSLDGLDSLSCVTSSANTTTKKSKKNKKFLGNYVKKVQSLLTKS
ncbi:myeloid differentiation primary response protein MyD88-A [Nasonia vitripennis]|uniref:Myeloid differentiation primary response protein MyD88 n=1 Tax=Nasonia vitripennis TaxID=7425 RepID=A0A7M7HAG0_NASVI|nr:myeloid differentiation primary response protein MyD88-A [Nasonia vitripennis]